MQKKCCNAAGTLTSLALRSEKFQKTNMKTGAIFLKALVIGGFVLSLANFSPEAQAATPLTTDNRTILNRATAGDVAGTVIAILAAAPQADRVQLAKDIVAHLAGRVGVSREVLKLAVRTAVAQLPGNAPGIAAAAAQSAVSNNAGNQTDLVKAIVEGAKLGAPTELASVVSTLVGALPSLQAAINEAASAGSSIPVNPGVNNSTDTSTSSKS